LQDYGEFLNWDMSTRGRPQSYNQVTAHLVTWCRSNPHNPLAQQNGVPPTVLHKMSGTNSNANSTLTTALKETLERTGMLDDARAQLRIMVLHCMNECLSTPTSSKTQALLPLLSTN
jgi:hypothetical protein